MSEKPMNLKNKKRVCHFTSAHDSDDTRIFYKECTSLAENGYEVFLVAQGNNREENGVHVIGLGRAPENRIRRMITFAKKAYKTALKLDCDVYHIHDPELLPYGLKLKKRGKTVIFDSHENTLEQMEEKEWIPKLIRKVVSKGYKIYATRIFQKIDALISVTPHIVNQLKEINPNTWMITNYPVLVDLPSQMRQKGRFSICFTGGISEQWSHDFIVGVLVDLNDVEYNLCGSTSKEYLDKLSSLSGWKKVNYYGNVSHARSIAIQQKADVGIALLQPSKNTGGIIGTIGNTKIFEYMMVGLPIVCTNFVMWKEIIEKWKCGICIPPDDKEAFIAAVEYIHNHLEEAEIMRENGRKAVREEFNWETQERKLLSLYGEILDGTGN